MRKSIERNTNTVTGEFCERTLHIIEMMNATFSFDLFSGTESSFHISHFSKPTSRMCVRVCVPDKESLGIVQNNLFHIVVPLLAAPNIMHSVIELL